MMWKKGVQAYRQGFKWVNLRDGDLRGHAASRVLMKFGLDLQAFADAQYWSSVHYSRRQCRYDVIGRMQLQISDKRDSAERCLHKRKVG